MILANQPKPSTNTCALMAENFTDIIIVKCVCDSTRTGNTTAWLLFHAV